MESRERGSAAPAIEPHARCYPWNHRRQAERVAEALELAAGSQVIERVADVPLEAVIGAQTRADVRFARLDREELAPLTMREPDANRQVLEVVIGSDDRQRVTPTTAYAWRCICMLRITARDGSVWYGTGWFASPKLVVTAGHVVHIASRGGWVQEIEVVPACDGSSRPFGAVTSRRFRSVEGWVDGEQAEHDYGAVLLPQPVPGVGYFGFAAASEEMLDGKTVLLSGYPSDKPLGTQWQHERHLQRIEPRLLYYDIDTAGGQSGAPVWTSFNGRLYAVGIHTGGMATGNSAVRLTSEVFDNLTTWSNHAA